MKDSSVLQPEGSKEARRATPEKTVVPRRVTKTAAENPRAHRTGGVKPAKDPKAPVGETSIHDNTQPQSRSRLDIMRRAASELARHDTSGARFKQVEDTPAPKPRTVEGPVETVQTNEDSVAQNVVHLSKTQMAEPVVSEAPADPDPEPQSAPEPSRALVSYDTWRDIPRISLGARLDGQPAQPGLPSLIEYFREDPIAKGFDLLRSRLVQTIRAYGWRKIAVVAPTPGCGSTFTAVNLALSLSRMPGSRTVLMDMNQRAPGIASALGLRTANRLDEFLQAKTRLEDYFLCPSKTLAVGLAAAPRTCAAEVLYDPLSEEVLDDMMERLNPNLVIYDMPAMLSYDDMTAFLPQVDGVLLVVDGTQTVPDHISACERILEGQTQLLGVVLNRGRSDSNADMTL